jgi:hypothetical protein
MCTGRLSNHIYLQMVGDGDLHTLILPDTIRPFTATELLERILARDDTPKSASTLLREQQDPAVRLGGSSNATSTPCTWPPKTSSVAAQYMQWRSLRTSWCPG